MTSTVTSSSVRQTPSLTVPSTQNTAPVLEFRCLYTHDLRRKQKRWQDGLLRFHTFNKRIMVYDVPRNYIGDMHWREDEILQDGDEFKLDRGVLIQVGEATGTMEQDLTGLLEKRKKAPEVVINGEVSHQSPAVAMDRSTSAQSSQLRPKSLNALLGTPKGRIGRAALPTKSPYELRTENENSSCDHDRSAKRQRIESQLERRAVPNKVPPPRAPATFSDNDKVNMTVVGAFVDRRSENGRVHTSVRDSGLSPAGETVGRQPISPVTEDKTDKEDQASKPVVEALLKKRSGKSGSSDSTARPQKRKKGQNASVTPNAMEITKHPELEPATSSARISSVTKPIEIDSDMDATSSNNQPTQRSKLQMASRKPRKKLMYRDLLPEERSAIGHSSSNASISDRSSRNRSTSSRPDNGKRGPMAAFHKREQEQLNTRLNRGRAKEIQWEREEFLVDKPEDLFLSQEDIVIKSASHHETEENGPKAKADISYLTGSRRRNTEPVPSSARRLLLQETHQKMVPIPPSTIHSTAMTLAKMDEILYAGPQPKTSELVGDKDALTEVFPQDSPFSISKISPVVVSTIAPSKERLGSSPASQIKAHEPPENLSPSKIPIGTSEIPRLELEPLRTSTLVVQSEMQESKQRNSKTPSPDSYLPSFSTTSPKSVSPSSPPKDGPTSARDPQIHPQTHPNPQPANSLTPQPQTAAIIPPTTNPKPNSLPAFSRTVAPKPPPPPVPAPKHKVSEEAAFTKAIPAPPIPKAPDETVEVLSSQPPSPPPPAAPRLRRRKPDSLPAFTKVVPTKPRSPLQKSISDTSAMRPPSVLSAPGGGEESLSDIVGGEVALSEKLGGEDDSACVWGKEAWDLFGCGRDGVGCSYEDFKRKEGLV